MNMSLPSHGIGDLLNAGSARTRFQNPLSLNDHGRGVLTHPANQSGVGNTHGGRFSQQVTLTEVNFALLQGGISFQSAGYAGDPKVSLEAPVQEVPEAENNGFDSSEVVKNVLGFLKLSFARFVSEGYSDEELKGKFEAAREGVMKGVEEASTILEGMGMMTDSLKQGIDSAFKGINEGIVELELKYLGDAKPKAERKNENDQQVITKNTESKSASTAHSHHADSKPLRVSYLNALQYESSSHNSFELSLTTREGDKVNISLEAKLFNRIEHTSYGVRTRGGQASGMEFSAVSQESTYFRMSIEGDINDEESEAINALLNDVVAIANDFFEGDLNAALEQVLSVDYDSSQLQSFTLDLYSERSEKVRQSYQQVEQMGRNHEINAPNNMSDLRSGMLDKLNHLLESIELLNHRFEFPLSLLEQLQQA